MEFIRIAIIFVLTKLQSNSIKQIILSRFLSNRRRILIISKITIEEWKRHKRILKAAKGFRGASGDAFRQAKDATRRAMAYATRDRKVNKRRMRQLWITRINSAARMNGVSYSVLMNGLKKAGILLDRKVLADIALNNAAEFTKLVETAKSAL